MTIIRVCVGTTATYAGQLYEVTLNMNGEDVVKVVTSRHPVNRYGTYVCDEVLRTIKPGSAIWKRAMKAALKTE